MREDSIATGKWLRRMQAVMQQVSCSHGKQAGINIENARSYVWEIKTMWVGDQSQPLKGLSSEICLAESGIIW
jgi:hypothetical protein